MSRLTTFDPSLYLVTDRSCLPPHVSLPDFVAAAIDGGVRVVQLREKHLDTKDLVSLAKSLLAVTRAKKVPLIINDRADVVLAVEADGLHIGQDDMDAPTARRLIGPSRILGVTVETPAQARQAVLDGADYVGTSRVFQSPDPLYSSSRPSLGYEGVTEILTAASEAAGSAQRQRFGLRDDRDQDQGLFNSKGFPVIAMGGINPENVEKLLRNTSITSSDVNISLAGCAVSSAVLSESGDPRTTAAALSEKIAPLIARQDWRSSSPPRPVPFSSSAVTPQPQLSPGVSQRSERVQALVDMIVAAFNQLPRNKPLVHNITNYVVMNDTANAILHVGGLPVMAHSADEVSEITNISHSLVLNIGTLSKSWVQAMHMASQTARSKPIPVVLDPVGAGATSFRTSTSIDLLSTGNVSIIKGNPAEIRYLAGTSQRMMSNEDSSMMDMDQQQQRSRTQDNRPIEIRGVESIGELLNPVNTALEIANTFKCVAAISGKVDTIVSPGRCTWWWPAASENEDVVGGDGEDADDLGDITNSINDGNMSTKGGSGPLAVQCYNGNHWLASITGSGCITSALIGCLAAVLNPVTWSNNHQDEDSPTPSPSIASSTDFEFDPMLVATVGGFLIMGIAAEVAVMRLKGIVQTTWKFDRNEELKHQQQARRAAAEADALAASILGFSSSFPPSSLSSPPRPGWGQGNSVGGAGAMESSDGDVGNVPARDPGSSNRRFSGGGGALGLGTLGNFGGTPSGVGVASSSVGGGGDDWDDGFVPGPGIFKVALMDSLYRLDAEEIQRRAKVVIINDLE
ncbi:hypothetical protein HK102_013595 [Quaeritorhiza haematococci]|nr:hypothetical protein HK102_013595 [Quaeritorhiza haematococci]